MYLYLRVVSYKACLSVLTVVVGGLEKLGDVEDDGEAEDREEVLEHPLTQGSTVVHRLAVVDRVVDGHVPTDNV